MNTLKVMGCSVFGCTRPVTDGISCESCERDISELRRVAVVSELEGVDPSHAKPFTFSDLFYVLGVVCVASWLAWEMRWFLIDCFRLWFVKGK